MKLVEVIAGMNTKAETVERIKEISVEIGKTPVEVKEAAGFVVNRILIPMINERWASTRKAWPARGYRYRDEAGQQTIRWARCPWAI